MIAIQSRNITRFGIRTFLLDLDRRLTTSTYFEAPTGSCSADCSIPGAYLTRSYVTIRFLRSRRARDRNPGARTTLAHRSSWLQAATKLFNPTAPSLHRHRSLPKNNTHAEYDEKTPDTHAHDVQREEDKSPSARKQQKQREMSWWPRG